MKAIKNSNAPKYGDCKQGICKDCGQDFYWRDEYIVRPEVWTAAGEHGYYGTGLLHRRCLEKRLGRKLTKADLLVWFSGHHPTTGDIRFACHSDAEEFLMDK